MLKWFNKKKKDNKGFTLVELIIVVAILAILVGLLAPQYTKYVEKSRRTADVSNLEEIVKQIKVTVSDPQSLVPEGDFKVVIDGTQAEIVYTPKDTAKSTPKWEGIMLGMLEGNWDNTVTNKLKTESLKLKSSKWKNKAGTYAIGATVEITADDTMTVTYDPENIKDGIF